MNTERSEAIAPSGRSTERGFQRVILRMVKGGPERQAIEAGQGDAVVDSTSGVAILLPDAQRAMQMRNSIRHGLIGLAFDWMWEQDENYRFVSHTGVTHETSGFGDESIIGKTLWDLAIDNKSAADWEVHRQQLEWHATFHDLEIRCLNRKGEAAYFSISGEPVYDDDHHFKGYRGIVRDIAAHRRFSLADQEHNRLAAACVDGFAAPVCLLDRTGRVLLTNKEWQIFASKREAIGAGSREGANYLAMCDSAVGDQRMDGIAIAAGIRQVFAQERDIFRYDFASQATTAPAGHCWYALRVTAITIHEFVHAVVALEDITARKRAEMLLELECKVAQSVGTASHAAAGIKSVIGDVCVAKGWDCGRYFTLDRTSGVLRFTEAWGIPTTAIAEFLEKSRTLVFQADAGLVGRAVQSRQVVWALEGSADPFLATMALAPETGRESSIVFPVTSGDKVIGALAFTGRNIKEPIDRTLRTLQSIGSQLGRFIEQQESLEALRGSEERFRRLTQLSSDWYWEQDCNLRFTKFVGFGPFDDSTVRGMTSWELPNVVLADSLWSAHKYQLAERWSFCDFAFAVVRADGSLGNYCISGEPVYDDDGTFTGYRGTGVEISKRKKSEVVLPDDDGHPSDGASTSPGGTQIK